MADIENLPVKLAKPVAKVILNARTGSVVLNESVTLGALRRGARQPVGDDLHRRRR